MSPPWEDIWYRGVRPGAGARAALTVAAAAFGAAVRVRNSLYDHRVLPVHRVTGARVFSVGNVNVGGAGKTPTVIYLANRLAAEGRSVAVLSRGYGRSAGGVARVAADSRAGAVGDEPLLIARRCPGVAVWVCADRVEAARRAIESGANALILDDGMQHRRLARDVEIAVLDGSVVLGNGQLLPRGPLREPPSALARADLVWIHGGDQTVAPAGLKEGAAVVRARHQVARVRSPTGEARAPSALAGRALFAFAGIARPERLRRTLEELGARVAGVRWFADHHPYSEAELARVRAEAAGLGADLVTSEKDASRLPPGFPAWVLELEVEVYEGEAALAACLAR